MTDVRNLVQTVLDNALSSDGVRVFWRRRIETEGENPDEYVVYTLDGDSDEVFADDASIIKSANIAVRYYYRDTFLDTSAGRGRIKARENEIAEALKTGGFSLPKGFFDVGDIDDIGYGATVFECDYWRVN